MIGLVFLKSYFSNLALANGQQSYANITSLLEKNSKPKVFLDVGCYRGEMTKIWAKHLGAQEVWGIEILEPAIKMAKQNGVNKIYRGDLNLKWSLPKNSVDALVASQVIEHLWDTDNFITEIYRVLKPGGYAVIATDNMASWHNIIALVLGWQIFPLTNVSSKKNGVGNPLAMHQGEPIENDMPKHLRIFTIRALKELFEIHGLVVEATLREGWFPLPNRVANWILKIDRVHSASVELKIRKPG